ncbi:MAG: carbonic anhydrase [Thermoguttaceae bacterium]
MSDLVPPDVAIRLLKEGNSRFVAGRRSHPHEFLTRAYETALLGQKPRAVILSCSDSRVPLEIIFDQGLGDLFVIRVAGNVCGPSELASIEFAIKTTGVQLCVILGHSQCGAVSAAWKSERHGDNIDNLITAIEPAVLRVGELIEKHIDFLKGDFLDTCCRENVFVQIESLFEQSPVIREAVRGGQVQVVGAFYNIEWGEVTFLESPADHEKYLHDILSEEKESQASPMSD